MESKVAILGSNLDITGAVNYHYGKFPPELNIKSFIKQLLKADNALARYDQMLKTMHNSELLLAPLRNQEAVISSRMEGTISTMDEILQYQADFEHDESGANDVRSEIRETVLYEMALKDAQRKMEEGQPLSKYLIRAAHERLLSHGRGALKAPGQFKTEQNFLADKNRKVVFVPISPERLEEGLDLMFNFIEKSDEEDLIKVALTHVEFESLHPFKDGNGRIGRMLITLMSWKSGLIKQPHYYISGYFEEHKDEYIDSMRRVSEHNDWNGWCEFFLKAVEAQAINNLEIVERIKNLYDEMKEKFADALNSRHSGAVLDFVFTYPVFRTNKLTNSTKFNKASVPGFLKLLVENKLLTITEEGSGRRPARYSFEPLMELLRV
jgi:Fic family protein